MKHAREDRSVGREIRKARIDKRMTQHDLVQATGLRPWNISTIERDKADPPFSVMQQIATVLGISLDALPPVERPSRRLGRGAKKATARRTVAAQD
jgi:transcriptional regulator with XRE-family HTH domain